LDLIGNAARCAKALKNYIAVTIFTTLHFNRNLLTGRLLGPFVSYD